MASLRRDTPWGADSPDNPPPIRYAGPTPVESAVTSRVAAVVDRGTPRLVPPARAVQNTKAMRFTITLLVAATLTLPRALADTGTSTAGKPLVVLLPRVPDATRFAVIGDGGTGKTPQYEVAEMMEAAHAVFPFGFVLMAGDNLYGGDGPDDYSRKFEKPYRILLEKGVQFYASLGNHDNPHQRFYRNST